MQQELNNSLIDFNELKLAMRPESAIGFWDDVQFLYEPPCTHPSKPHMCIFCSRAFSRRYDLVRHTRVHTGIKPYGCPCCQKYFARSDARRRHFQSDSLCSNHSQVKYLNSQRRKKSNK